MSTFSSGKSSLGYFSSSFARLVPLPLPPPVPTTQVSVDEFAIARYSICYLARSLFRPLILQAKVHESCI